MGQRRTRSSARKVKPSEVLSPTLWKSGRSASHSLHDFENSPSVAIDSDDGENSATSEKSAPPPFFLAPNEEGSNLEAENGPAIDPVADSVVNETNPNLQQSAPTAEIDGEPVEPAADEVSGEIPNSKGEGDAADGNPKTTSSGGGKKFPQKNQQSPWADLFKTNRSPAQGDKLERDEGYNPVTKRVALRVDDGYTVEQAWRHTLIGYVAGKFPGKNGIKSVMASWKVPAKYYIHSSYWIVFKFEDELSMHKVVEGGPYFVYNAPLLLKEIPEYFCFDDEDMSTMPVWVTLPCLPREFWKAKALGKILTPIGNPIRTDQRTATLDAVGYARALVEVDASKDLLKSVTIDLPNGNVLEQIVNYEYNPTFCKKCRCIGHKTAKCKKSANDPPKVTPSDIPAANVDGSPTENLVDENATILGGKNAEFSGETSAENTGGAETNNAESAGKSGAENLGEANA